MSTIIFSEIKEDSKQIDGRRYITEIHTDDLGCQYHVVYMAEKKSDPREMLALRAKQLNAQMATDAEAVAVKRLAEKERAVELLKLADASIKKILMVDDVAQIKEQLTDEAARR